MLYYCNKVALLLRQYILPAVRVASRWSGGLSKAPSLNEELCARSALCDLVFLGRAKRFFSVDANDLDFLGSAGFINAL